MMMMMIHNECLIQRTEEKVACIADMFTGRIN